MTSVEYNKACVEKLKRFDFENRVAVIGSGFSYELYANINELTTKMQKACQIDIDKNEPSCAFFERAYRRDPLKYFEIIRESFDKTKPWDARAYRHIVNIGFKSLVTLNFDDQLPNAYEKYRRSVLPPHFKVFPGQCIFLPSDFSKESPSLVAVHGYKNDNDPEWHKKVILRTGDYEDHYFWKTGPPPFLYLWWYWLLTTHPCVFIATSLNEPGLAAVMRDITETGRGFNRPSHIHLKSTNLTSPNYVEEEKTSLKVIRQILYDPLDINHTGLNLVLSHFSGISESSPLPQAERQHYSIADSLDFLNQNPNT